MTRRLVCLLGLVGTLAACGGSSTPLLTAPLSHQLVSLNQMQSPGFVVNQAPQVISTPQLATSSSQRRADLGRDGLVAAEQVAYLRNVGDFLDSDGPVGVIATVSRFSGVAGAHAWFITDSARLSHLSGALQISTGPLGGESLAISQIAGYPGGGDVVRITIEWRTDNLVNVVQVEGRYGGTGLNDALYVALRQQRNEAD